MINMEQQLFAGKLNLETGEESKYALTEEEIQKYLNNQPKDDYWEKFRNYRNAKLSSSDWTQYGDSPLTKEQKNAWKTYRQQLRDLPSIITDPKPFIDEEIDNIFNNTGYNLWPTPPKSSNGNS